MTEQDPNNNEKEIPNEIEEVVHQDSTPETILAEDTFEDSDEYLRSRADMDEEEIVEENVTDDLEDESQVEDIDVAVTYKSAIEKLFLYNVPKNSKYSEKLRTHLTAPIVVRVKDTSDVYTIDWTKTDIKVTSGDVEKPGCVVMLKEQHLLDIAAGQLNPQVAMLSDKIEIEGKMELAVYVFNLMDRKSAWAKL